MAGQAESAPDPADMRLGELRLRCAIPSYLIVDAALTTLNPGRAARSRF